MQLFNNINEWRSFRKGLQGSLGFVPTMGALHQGHLELVKRSLQQSDQTVVSIYVNPTQFDNKSDLENYPITLEDDLELLKELGVDYVIAPSFEQIYADNYRYKVSDTKSSNILCGAKREGHFDGVLTVVLKLFNIVRPTNAYFGEKDYQQMKLISDMVDALFLDINIVPCPIVRDQNGIALSSRNRLLSAHRQKEVAEIFSRQLGVKPFVELTKEIEAAGMQVDYLEEHWGRCFGAIYCDGVRLIDNVSI